MREVQHNNKKKIFKSHSNWVLTGISQELIYDFRYFLTNQFF